VDKPSKEETAYWERVLHDHNLGMDRGRSGKVGGERRLTHVGDSNDLATVESKIVAKKTGQRVRPKGARPE
jgi:hypothetical protein